MSKPILTQSRLRALFDYDPETGVFIWKKALSPRVKAGMRAGSPGSSGYWSIQIDGKLHLLHRLAWLYMTGSWPTECVDHINGVVNDNKWCNLREATRSQNLQNQKIRSPFMGVFPHGSGWRAKIKANRVEHYLGIFPTPSLAHAAYLTAKRQLHGAFSR